MHCHYRVYCLLVVLLVMVGCTSNQQLQTQADPPNDTQAEWDMVQLPALPEGRSMSVFHGDALFGSEVFQKSANASISSMKLELMSDSDTVSWGIWEFDPGLNYLTSVEISFSVPEGHEAYIALADYSRGIWEHYGPAVPPDHLLLLDSARHKSADSLFYVAVIVVGGNQATINAVTLRMDDGWTITTVDSDANVASLSAAIVEGHPMIAYYRSSTALECIRALDPYGQDWGPAQIIDDDGNVGGYCSLAVVNGHPAVAYYDDDDDDLLYVRADDSTGADWPEPVIAAFGGDSGTFNSMVVADGIPIISHYNAGGSYVTCAVALDANGAEWDTPWVIDSDGETGMHGSMAIINGFPAACYRSDNNLRFARSNNVSGKGWPITGKQTIDDQAGKASYTSLAWINGAPAISYWRSDDADLCYLRGFDANGDSWTTPVVLDGEGGVDTGLYSSLADIGGVPAIAYYSSTSEDLYFIQARDADGANWYPPTIIDSLGITGTHCRLIEIDGMPGIAYYDMTANELKFAIRQEP